MARPTRSVEHREPAQPLGSFKCATCRAHELIELRCKQCGKNHCVRHRAPRDHKCSGRKQRKKAPPVDENIAASSARGEGRRRLSSQSSRHDNEIHANSIDDKQTAIADDNDDDTNTIQVIVRDERGERALSLPSATTAEQFLASVGHRRVISRERGELRPSSIEIGPRGLNLHRSTLHVLPPDAGLARPATCVEIVLTFLGLQWMLFFLKPAEWTTRVKFTLLFIIVALASACQTDQTLHFASQRILFFLYFCLRRQCRQYFVLSRFKHHAALHHFVENIKHTIWMENQVKLANIFKALLADTKIAHTRIKQIKHETWETNEFKKKKKNRFVF